MSASSSPTPLTGPGRASFMVVIVDSDEFAGELLGELVKRHVEAVICPDPAEALLRVGDLHPDAVLAAANLHPVDSPSLVRLLHQGPGIPVLVGVGDGDGRLAALALAAGATACVARPYRPWEILPILRAVRAGSMPVDHPVQIGALHLDPTALQVHLHGKPVHLPNREFQLLHLLMINADRVVTRQHIKAKVWGASSVDVSNTVTVHVQRLRARLGDDPHHPTIIQTVRGLGYRLVAPTRPTPDRAAESRSG